MSLVKGKRNWLIFYLMAFLVFMFDVILIINPFVRIFEIISILILTTFMAIITIGFFFFVTISINSEEVKYQVYFKKYFVRFDSIKSISYKDLSKNIFLLELKNGDLIEVEIGIFINKNEIYDYINQDLIRRNLLKK